METRSRLWGLKQQQKRFLALDLLVASSYVDRTNDTCRSLEEEPKSADR